MKAIKSCAMALVILALGALPNLAAESPPLQFNFNGTEYLHRWSKQGQNEFTPKDQPDLEKWTDMVTINVHDKVSNGDQLAEVANRVVGNYSAVGKVLKTDSKPRTDKEPAQHFVAAILGTPKLLEAVFARFVIVDGTGYVIVASHRIYGDKVGPQMSKWLQENGPLYEKNLMDWRKMPNPPQLKALPQSS